MKSGYKVFWSKAALSDLQNIIDYLSENWTFREIQNFAKRLDKRVDLIALNPKLFAKTSKRKNVRRSVLTKHTVIYYESNEATVTILSQFDSRQNPKRLRF